MDRPTRSPEPIWYVCCPTTCWWCNTPSAAVGKGSVHQTSIMHDHVEARTAQIWTSSFSSSAELSHPGPLLGRWSIGRWSGRCQPHVFYLSVPPTSTSQNQYKSLTFSVFLEQIQENVIFAHYNQGTIFWNPSVFPIENQKKYWQISTVGDTVWSLSSSSS